MRIPRGIPRAVVDAVQDARHPVGTVAQQSVEAATELGAENLAGVCGTHRRDEVAALQPALQEGQHPVELDTVQRERSLGEPQRAEHVGREVALEREVVDGDHRGGALVPVQVAQIGRSERGLPVVAVEHLRDPVDRRSRRRDKRGNAAEQPEAQRVVGPVAALRVEVGIAFAREGLGRLEQQHAQSVGQRGLPQRRCRQGSARGVDPRELATPAERRHQRRIRRHQHADVAARRHQRTRQRSGDVAEAAGLHPRRDLRNREQDSHRRHPRGTACRVATTSTSAPSRNGGSGARRRDRPGSGTPSSRTTRG